MGIKLDSEKKQIDLAVRNGNLNDMLGEIDDVISRLETYRNEIIASSEAEESFRAATKRLEATTNVKISLKRTSYKRPPKYQYKDSGEWKTWAGVGKMPAAIRKKVEVDGVIDEALLEKYLIVKDEKAVYQFKDEEGMIRTWSGKGATPKALQLLIDRNGHKLEDFKIITH